jgi:hypothetical protein
VVGLGGQRSGRRERELVARWRSYTKAAQGHRQTPALPLSTSIQPGHSRRDDIQPPPSQSLCTCIRTDEISNCAADWEVPAQHLTISRHTMCTDSACRRHHPWGNRCTAEVSDSWRRSKSSDTIP